MLDAIGAVGDKDKHQVPMSELLSLAKEVFNIEFGQPYREKKAILNWKGDKQHITGRMSEALNRLIDEENS